jgi:hypothetical protein
MHKAENYTDWVYHHIYKKWDIPDKGKKEKHISRKKDENA